MCQKRVDVVNQLNFDQNRLKAVLALNLFQFNALHKGGTELVKSGENHGEEKIPYSW